MLGYLKGVVLSKHTDSSQCLILSHRVGYEVILPKSTFDALIVSTRASLWIHTHVREDQITLFGFANEGEKNFFRLLLTVSGLGPKTALALLSHHGSERLYSLVLGKKTSELSSAPGVGKKIAEKLVIELSGRLEKLVWTRTLEATSKPIRVGTDQPRLGAKEDLASALTYLGYPPNSIKATLERLFDRDSMHETPFEEMLRMALSEISGRPLNRPETL